MCNSDNNQGSIIKELKRDWEGEKEVLIHPFIQASLGSFRPSPHPDHDGVNAVKE